MEITLIYMTAKDKSSATALAKALLAEKLIACANILPPITSCYEWEGVMEEAEEVVIIAKTRADWADKVMKRAAELHEYECPCVLALPVSAAHAPFAAWVHENTALT